MIRGRKAADLIIPRWPNCRRMIIGAYLAYFDKGLSEDPEEYVMKNNRFLMVQVSVGVTLIVALISCGGEDGGIPPFNTGAGQFSKN